MSDFRVWWATAAMAISLGVGRPAQAQDLLGERVNLHPIKDQVGVVTWAEGTAVEAPTKRTRRYGARLARQSRCCGAAG